MKKLLLSFLFVASATAFAQEMKPKQLVLIDGMIASKQLVDSEKSNVLKVDIYKNTDKIPGELESYGAFIRNGITNVKVKENYYDQVPLFDLNRQFDLPDDNPVYVDGNLITHSDVKILGNVLESLKSDEINGQRVLVIETTPKK